MFYDNKYRSAAFEWLSRQIAIHGETLPSSILRSFTCDGIKIPLIGMKGIWKPKVFPVYPISIMTSFNSQYQDGFSDDKTLEYSYRGNDPNHSDNIALRKAMRDKVPLIYFLALAKAKYATIFPVFISGYDDRRLIFNVIADDVHYICSDKNDNIDQIKDNEDARRQYVTAVVKHRLHQQSFREKVLSAYREQCAICHFKHGELLDAAHIIPDGEPNGEPIVINGLSLCKFHHAAYDNNMISINPDYYIEIRPKIRDEKDGPMLLYGLQGLHGNKIILPHDSKKWPDKERLEERYQRYKKAL